MRVGVIGAGIMGKNHIRIYSELKGVDEVYVFDENKKEALELYGANILTSIEELLNKVELVSICTPTKTHFEIAKNCIRKGIPCLIEKPITLNYQEGKKLVDMDKDKKIIGVGHIERFNPIISEIAKIIKKPVYVEIKRHNPSSTRITDVSIIEDLMIHDIDVVFNKLFKDKDYKLKGVIGNYEICNVFLEFNSCFVSLSASRMANKKIRKIYIEEKDKTIEGDFMTQEIFVYKKPSLYLGENAGYKQENIIEKVLVNKIEPLRIELKTVIDCLKNRTSFPVNASEAIFNLKICEEIKGSLI